MVSLGLCATLTRDLIQVDDTVERKDSPVLQASGLAATVRPWTVEHFVVDAAST